MGSLVGPEHPVWGGAQSPNVQEESGVGGILLKDQGVCPLSCVQWEPLEAFEEDNGGIRTGLWEARFSLCLTNDAGPPQLSSKTLSPSLYMISFCNLSLNVAIS